MATETASDFDLTVEFFQQAGSREDLVGRLSEALERASEVIEGQDIHENYRVQKIMHLEELHENILLELQGADASDQATVDAFRRRGFMGAADRVEFNESDLQIAELFLEKATNVVGWDNGEWQEHVDYGGTLPLDDMQRMRVQRFLEAQYRQMAEQQLQQKHGEVDPEAVAIFVENMKPFVRAQAQTTMQDEYAVMKNDQGWT